MKDLTKEELETAFAKLDSVLEEHNAGTVRLILGGGGSMILAHGYPGKTSDADGAVTRIDAAEFDRYVKLVAQQLKIQPEWLNSHFTTYMYALPSDYDARLVNVYAGKSLIVDALGAEDILIMKLMAGRAKDMQHIRFLLRTQNVNLSIVEKRLEELVSQSIGKASSALDLFDDVTSEFKQGKNK